MRNVHTHYDNLKVARDAPPSVIKAAYRVLSQEWHPDKSASPNSERIMVLINRSYEVLSDPDQRRAHDTWITEQEAAAQQEAVAGHERAVEDEPAWTEQR
ncbi:J domain-containing protein, partial [Halobellus sp. Atlit-31R]